MKSCLPVERAVDGSEPDGLASLRVPQVEVPGRPRIAKKRESKRQLRWVDGEFLLGPLPMDWLSRASALPGKAIETGLAIWFLCGLRGRYDDLKLTTDVLARFHVNRSAK